MIAPRFRRLMSRSASRVQKNVPFRWTPIILCHASSLRLCVMSQWVWIPCPLSISPIHASVFSLSISACPGAVSAMPALLTRMSSVPNSRSISANIASTWWLSETSA